MKKRAKTCFINGNKYREFSEKEKTFYVIGIMDAILTMFFMIEPEKYQIIEDKVKSMTPLQIRILFDKYLEEKPEELRYCVASSFFYALDEIICE